MYVYEGLSVQTHDLLEIDVESFLRGVATSGDSLPDWASEHVRPALYGVVRRGEMRERGVPIGVRGVQRNERWATYCSLDAVRDVIPPSRLLECAADASRVRELAAFRTLEVLRGRWCDLDSDWGPGGSVGFEFATGRRVVHAGSDLDVVIRADGPIARERAKLLCAMTEDLPSDVDIRVETPIAGFSLKEYAQGDHAKILLRTAEGAVLGSDPWCDSPAVCTAQ